MITARPVMGPPPIRYSRVDAYMRRTDGISQWFKQATRHLWNAGMATGVDPLILIAQCAYETGWGNFGGAVGPGHNNTCGLKTRDADGDEPEDHEQFPDLATGALAHAHHLSLYCGVPVPDDTPDPRADIILGGSLFGSVFYVSHLGGKWAPNSDYGETVVDIVNRF